MSCNLEVIGDGMIGITIVTISIGTEYRSWMEMAKGSEQKQMIITEVGNDQW
jgi:hypothetical protein